MEDRLMSGGVSMVLTVVFGSYGIVALLRAFRAADFTTWTGQAVQGGLGMIASGVVADVALRLLV